MVESRKPGRPRKDTPPTAPRLIEDLVKKDVPKLVPTIEKYLLEAQWTKEQLMAAIGVGETQLYRWGRGDSLPRKATVNRIAVVLARRLDELHGDDIHEPFPASDQMDAMLNELLQTAGFSASVRGMSGDDCWNRIARRKSWKLGYTMVPEWAEPPTRRTGRPTGRAIDYAEQIGRLMGLETEWEYLGFDEMPLAIRERRLDGIAPLMVVLPGRLFDFRFSKPCGDTKFTLSALIPSQLSEKGKNFEDLSVRSVEILYVDGELGQWGYEVFGNGYQGKSFQDSNKAIAYMKAIVGSKERTIPVFLLDNVTANYLREDFLKDSDSDGGKQFLLSNIAVPIKMETNNAFAFHPDEVQLTNAVDISIDIFPLGARIFDQNHVE